jgi:hypothetical protein
MRQNARNRTRIAIEIVAHHIATTSHRLAFRDSILPNGVRFEITPRANGFHTR